LIIIELLKTDMAPATLELSSKEEIFGKFDGVQVITLDGGVCDGNL
jgi:hypothetical protein